MGVRGGSSEKKEKNIGNCVIGRRRRKMRSEKKGDGS